MAASGKLEGRDVAPLFEVLNKYGAAAAMVPLAGSDGAGRERIRPIADAGAVGAEHPDARTALLEQTRLNQIPASAWPYLLAPTGISSPHVTEAQVQEYLNEYAALPDSDPAARESAWRTIDTDIRLKLAPLVQAQYQEAVRKFFEQLKAQGPGQDHRARENQLSRRRRLRQQFVTRRQTISMNLGVVAASRESAAEFASQMAALSRDAATI